jgi:hypothetical protein
MTGQGLEASRLFNKWAITKLPDGMLPDHERHAELRFEEWDEADDSLVGTGVVLSVPTVGRWPWWDKWWSPAEFDFVSVLAEIMDADS